VWAAGGALAGLAALFVAPTVSVLTPGFASTHIFAVALVAAVVGGLSSLQGAFVGGLAVGLLKTEVLHVWVNSSWPGREYLVYMVIVVVMLLVRPNGLFSGVRLREAT
jgi:branched-chain amino acid transport system permease protein